LAQRGEHQMKKKSFRGNRSTKSSAGLKFGSLQVSADISHEHAQVFLVIAIGSEISNGAELPMDLEILEARTNNPMSLGSRIIC